MSDARLDLYELREREPCAYLDWEGRLHELRANVPSILFADVPVRLHLTCGKTIGPFADAASTGPVRAPIVR